MNDTAARLPPFLEAKNFPHEVILSELVVAQPEIFPIIASSSPINDKGLGEGLFKAVKEHDTAILVGSIKVRKFRNDIIKLRKLKAIAIEGSLRQYRK